MNLDYLDAPGGFSTFAPCAAALLDGPPREPGGPLTAREADLACSLRAVIEGVLLRAARHARDLTGERALCVAGGPALVHAACGWLRRKDLFEEIRVQPGGGGAGGALGAALLVWCAGEGRERAVAGPRQELLGPGWEDDAIAAWLEREGRPFRRLAPGAWVPALAALLAEGRVLGLFRGRMALGPRSPGSRSILVDPSRNARAGGGPERPWAALEPAAWTGLAGDGDDPRLAALLATLGGGLALREAPLAPPGEPVACTPAEALRVFARGDLDALALGSCVLLAEDQPSPPRARDWGPAAPWDWEAFPGLAGIRP